MVRIPVEGIILPVGSVARITSDSVLCLAEGQDLTLRWLAETPPARSWDKARGPT
jgi:hypothetical protein